MYAALLDCIVVPNNNFYTNNVFISFSRFHSDGRPSLLSFPAVRYLQCLIKETRVHRGTSSSKVPSTSLSTARASSQHSRTETISASWLSSTMRRGKKTWVRLFVGWRQSQWWTATLFLLISPSIMDVRATEKLTCSLFYDRRLNPLAVKKKFSFCLCGSYPIIYIRLS